MYKLKLKIKMTKEEMQKQILDAVSSGALKAANIVMGDMVEKKIRKI